MYNIISTYYNIYYYMHKVKVSKEASPVLKKNTEKLFFF